MSGVPPYTSPWRHSMELLLTMSMTDLKLKYQNSGIGFLWSFLKPLLQFGVYYTIFAKILKVSQDPDYPLTLFYGVLVWSWFAEATSLALNAFISKRSIVTKVCTHKFFLPLASYLTPTLSHLLNVVVFAVAYAMYGPDHASSLTTWTGWGALLFGYLALSTLMVSVCTMVSILNVFFRDVEPVWELVLMYGVFLTPVIYPLPVPPEWMTLYYLVNPLAVPLLTVKHVLFGHLAPPNLSTWQWGLYVAVLVFWAGMAGLVYRRGANRLVDFL